MERPVQRNTRVAQGAHPADRCRILRQGRPVIARQGAVQVKKESFSRHRGFIMPFRRRSGNHLGIALQGIPRIRAAFPPMMAAFSSWEKP